MLKNLIFLSLLLSLSLTISLNGGCHEPKKVKEIRLAYEKLQGFSTLTQEMLHKRKQIASKNKWRPLSIYFDLTKMEKGLAEGNKSHLIPFYRKVFQVVGNWWGQSLMVNDDRSKIAPLIRKTNSDCLSGELSGASCDADFTGLDMNGHRMEDYDLIITAHYKDDPDDDGKPEDEKSTLAYASPALRHPDSQRPISGGVWQTPFGDNYAQGKKDNFESATSTIIHEFGHVISFIGWDSILKENTKFDQNIQKWLWIGKNVVQRAKQYYNCQLESFEGVPLQTTGKDNDIGAHWSGTYMGNEMMSPTDSERVYASMMTFAQTEDTHWYKPDYKYAESYFYRKGKGCVFEKCPKAECESGATNFILKNRQAEGYCTKTDKGCLVETMYANRDCNNPAGWSDEFKKGLMAQFGKNCAVVQGSFNYVHDGEIVEYSTHIPQASCSEDYKSYTLNFEGFKVDAEGEKVGGDVTVECKEKGVVKFNEEGEYQSQVNCEDPKEFCHARFGKRHVCDESCVLGGNGRCDNEHSGEWSCWCYKDGSRSTDGKCPVVTWT